MFLYILVVFSGLFNKPRMCAGIFSSKTSARGFKPWWMESCTHNSKQQKLVCSDPKKLVSSESIDWNACLCSVFCQVETSCLLVFRFLSSWNIMLACVPVSVKWGHLRNIVCYFFCNALIVSCYYCCVLFWSTFPIQLWSLKPPFVSIADDLMKIVMMTVLQTQVVM